MFATDFLDLLQRQPFEPFRVHLNNGSSFEIRHPEIAATRPSVAWLYYPAQQYPIPMAERKVVVVLQNIASVEFLAPPPAPSAN